MGEPLAARPLTRPHRRRLAPDHSRYAEILQVHAAALEAGEAGYPDPDTGLFVLTAGFLADRGYCCGRGCRHCPYVDEDELVTTPYRMNWSNDRQYLSARADTDAAWTAAVAAELIRPTDRLAVDVGCGAGGMTAALAAAMPGRRVIGVDSSPDVLASARERLAGSSAELVEASLPEKVPEVRELLGSPADLIWASASVHHAGDQQAMVDALASLLAPGGRLALAEGGLPDRHLPWDVGVGQPGLEHRLDAAHHMWFALMRANLPGAVRMPYGWTAALRRAKLTEVTTRSWLLELAPPLDQGVAERIAASLAHRVERLRPTGLLNATDLAAWDRLTDPDDDAWLGRRDDVFRLTVRSVHVGVRP